MHEQMGDCNRKMEPTKKVEMQDLEINRISEINSLVGLISNKDTAKRRTIKRQDRWMEILQTETQNRKNWKKEKKKIEDQEQWDNIKWSNMSHTNGTEKRVQK